MDAETIARLLALLGVVPASPEVIAADLAALAARAAAGSQPGIDDDPTGFARAQA